MHDPHFFPAIYIIQQTRYTPTNYVEASGYSRQVDSYFSES